MNNPVVTPLNVHEEPPEQKLWDVIVIGGGMGGGSTAYSLAHQHKSVLLIEKGLSEFSESAQEYSYSEIDDPGRRMNLGMWPEKISTKVDGVGDEIWAPLGCGLGGSTLLYAAALNRLEPSDFESQNGPNNRLLRWPFTYQEIEPFYTKAEELFRVSGTPNPLRPEHASELREPEQLSPLDTHFFEMFESKGLHPYRLHVGVENTPGCEGCGGYVCSKSCKQDSYTSCIKKSLSTGNLTIFSDTEVLRLLHDKRTVNGVVIRRGDSEIVLQATNYVLAAGAYFSPVILLKSVSEDWPTGLGNKFDLVGRNLMFHISEHIGIWPKGRFSHHGLRNTIALRDFYRYEGEKFGEFQSTGITVGFGSMYYYLITKYGHYFRGIFKLFRILLKLPALIASKILKDATVFACILEDYPYLENRITLNRNCKNDMLVEYTIHKELKARIRKFRKILKKVLKNTRHFPSTDGIWLNYGHPCGTCVAGEDESTSVVDKNCKVHNIDNLFISDASIFPTSGGTNPSLTIAANGLRVGEHISTLLNSKT